MATELRKLLSSIDPNKTKHEIERRANRAFDNFPQKSGRIENWEDYQDKIARLKRTIENHVLRIEPPLEVNRAYDGHQAMTILRQKFGPQGDKAAFEMVRTGREGGLKKVLKTLCDGLIEYYTDNEIRGRISHYWNSLTNEQRHKAIQEFLDNYSHLLPSELTEGSAARIRVNFPEFLAKFPELLEKLRRAVRR